MSLISYHITAPDLNGCYVICNKQCIMICYAPPITTTVGYRITIMKYWRAEPQLLEPAQEITSFSLDQISCNKGWKGTWVSLYRPTDWIGPHSVAYVIRKGCSQLNKMSIIVWIKSNIESYYIIFVKDVIMWSHNATMIESKRGQR